MPSVGPVDKDGKFYTGNWLVAIDPSTQKEKWRVQGGGSIGGGALTTAGNLVFQVQNNGHLLAYRADTGEKLLDVATNQTGNMGPPITFMIDNKQYVAVAGGAGPRGGFGGAPGTRRDLVPERVALQRARPLCRQRQLRPLRLRRRSILDCMRMCSTAKL